MDTLQDLNLTTIKKPNALTTLLHKQRKSSIKNKAHFIFFPLFQKLNLKPPYLAKINILRLETKFAPPYVISSMTLSLQNLNTISPYIYLTLLPNCTPDLYISPRSTPGDLKPTLSHPTHPPL